MMSPESMETLLRDVEHSSGVDTIQFGGVQIRDVGDNFEMVALTLRWLLEMPEG